MGGNAFGSCFFRQTRMTLDMASTSRETMNSQSHSSPRTSYSRPQLLRACVTAPTLVTSYASRNDRSSPNFGAIGLHSSSRDRATMLLNRVASYSYGCSEKLEGRRKQVTSAEKRIVSSPGGKREVGERGGKSKKGKISVQVHNDGGKHGAYFSFPSFEEFEEYSEKEESDGGDPRGRRR